MATLQIDPRTGERVQIDPSTGERSQPSVSGVTNSPSIDSEITPDVSAEAWKAAVHSQILGTTPSYAYQNREEINKQMREQGGDDYDKGIGYAIKTGFEETPLGLLIRGKAPDPFESHSHLGNFIHDVSEMVSDPLMLASAFTAEVGVGVAGFAADAALRKTLMDQYTKGDVKSFGELADRAGAILWEGSKGALLAKAGMAAGEIPVGRFVEKSPLASSALKGLYQSAAMTTAGSLLNGQLPNVNDFERSAALIVPLNLATGGAFLRTGEAKQALMDNYAESGVTPRDAKEKIDAQVPVKQDMPEGLRPAIQFAKNSWMEGILPEEGMPGEEGERHSDLVARRLGEKPVEMDQLQADPELADKVLQNPTVHEQSVIDEAYKLKKEAIESGQEPPVPEGHTRLYRGGYYGVDKRPEWTKSEPYQQAAMEASGRWFTKDRNEAVFFKDEVGAGQGELRYIDVPDSEAQKYQAQNDPEANKFIHHTKRGQESDEHFLPKEMASKAQPFPKSIDDLYDRGSLKSGRGFVTPDGKFLTREQAKKWMKENEPEVHQMWEESIGEDAKAELHSDAYGVARMRVGARDVTSGEPDLNLLPQNARRLAAAREALNKIKAGDASEGYIKEVIRTLFVGQRDTRIAATTQLRDAIQKIIPDFRDQEALSILRDYKDNLEGLAQELEVIRAGQSEKLKALIPSIERALRPTPELLRADKALTSYYETALSEGRELGFLESKIDPERYSPHILLKIMDGSEPGKVGRPALANRTPYAMERKYPTIIDALKQERLDARTVNALDALSVYGERHATVVATKLLTTELKNSELGKWGSRGTVPEGWREIAPQQGGFHQTMTVKDAATGESNTFSRGLFVPKEIADALKPIVEPGGVRNIPGVAKFLHIQAWTKSIELGLSVFHMKALTMTAMNNMSFADFTRSMLADLKSPEFAAAEQGWAADGLQTTKTSTPYEAYKGLKPSSFPSRLDVIRGVVGIKQIDQFAQALTRDTFDIIQRKFKVMDASLKIAAWIGKHPEASDTEYFAARRSIAKEVNAAYGGLNWEIMGWGKNARELTRMVMLAPDWTFSNIMNLKYTGEGGPAGAAARMFWIKSFATGIALTQATSLFLNGKLSDQATSVHLGTDKDGRELHANWFFAGAPKDAITLLNQVQKNGVFMGLANFITNKLGPIAGTMAGLVKNKDYSGKPIVKPEQGFVEKTAREGAYVASKAVPFTVTNIVQMLMDENEHSMMDYIAALAGSQTMHEGPKTKESKAGGMRLPGQSKGRSSFHLPGVKGR